MQISKKICFSVSTFSVVGLGEYTISPSSGNSPINPEEDINTYKKTITKGLNIKPRNFRILSI